MSIQNSAFIKPKTQIFTQQPNDKIETYDSISFAVDPQSIKKPIAYVLPIERPASKDKSIQTDFVNIESNLLIDIRDFERSERVWGLSEGREYKDDNKENTEIALLRSRVSVLQQAVEEQKIRNEEVKKLLVVSLGDDLASHFTKLMSDLTNTGDRVSALLTEKRWINDNIDQLAIEANIWKNKFTAGRILVNEMAQWKEQFAFRYQKSLEAIHNLLQERQSLRVQLTLLNDQLHLMSSHLGQTQSHKYYANTTDLVKHSLDIANTVVYLLSSGASWDRLDGKVDQLKQIKEFTVEEEEAIEVLMNRCDIEKDNSAKYVTSWAAKDQIFLEEMTLCICRNCRGDIFII